MSCSDASTVVNGTKERGFPVVGLIGHHTNSSLYPHHRHPNRRGSLPLKKRRVVVTLTGGGGGGENPGLRCLFGSRSSSSSSSSSPDRTSHRIHHPEKSIHNNMSLDFLAAFNTNALSLIAVAAASATQPVSIRSSGGGDGRNGTPLSTTPASTPASTPMDSSYTMSSSSNPRASGETTTTTTTNTRHRSNRTAPDPRRTTAVALDLPMMHHPDRKVSSCDDSRSPSMHSSKLSLRNKQRASSSLSQASSAAAAALHVEDGGVAPSTASRTDTSSPSSVVGGVDTSANTDKRCLGDEIRCSATTTRGRACAYIAVRDTRYCFLHAEYDIHPPPRRKSKDSMIIPTTTTIASESSYSSTSEDSSSGSEPPPCGSGTGILNIDSSPVIVDETVFKRERNSKQRTGVGKSKEKQRTQPPVDARIDTEVPGTKRKSTTTKATPMPAATAVPSPPCKKRLRRTSVKLAEKHADSKHPLLSMIATEQWFGKTVHIAVGPLEGRTGLVQKWGNGWVSVRVKGVGLHNRRSLELYISDDELKEGNAMDVEVNQSVEIIKKSLSRSVSREAVSPSPSSDSSLKSLCSGSKTLSKEHADFQPRVEQTLVSPLFCRQGKNRKISMAIENTSLDDVVFLPETPRPSCVDPRPRETPKVTPFNDSSAVKASQHTLSLLTSDSTMHLQLPDASPSVKNLTKTVSGRHCGMVFRPSMGERTRGRTASYCEEEDTIASVSFTTSDVDHLL